jgi:iron complex transport system substrate-binding protein
VRIVSLCPSITETLVAFGLAESLVGVTRWCVHPREVTAGIPKVGGTKDPDLEAIRSLRPDLVFANAEENRREDVEALAREFDVDVSHPRRVADVPPLLRRWGLRTGTGKTAERIASKVEDAAGRAERGLEAAPAFRSLYLVWKNPWMVAGPRTYVADLLRLAGGVSSFEEDPRGSDYPATDEGTVLAARSDVLVLPDEPYHFGEKDASYWRERLPASTRVVLVPGDDWCWHGVRTLRGLEAAEALAREMRVEA